MPEEQKSKSEKGVEESAERGSTSDQQRKIDQSTDPKTGTGGQSGGQQGGQSGSGTSR